MHEYTRTDQHDDGFTLVEIIIAIRPRGHPVGGRRRRRRQHRADRQRSQLRCVRRHRARTGATAYWASHAGYPTTFTQLVSPAPPFLELPDSATVDPAGTTVTTPDWTLTLTSTSGAPTFACGTAPPPAPAGPAAAPLPAPAPTPPGWASTTAP